jgi:alpha-ribazole phosphatase
MLKLTLVRHGETEWNAQRRYQGQTDIPLSAIGVRQAELVAERLTGEKFDAIYTSDLKRAWQTARFIAEKVGLSVSAEPRLREMAFGVLEGLIWDEAEEKYPKMLKAWLEDYNQPPDGGESLDAFSERILSCRDDLLAKHNAQRVLLVAHGGSLSELVRLSLDVPLEKRWAFAMNNASISELWLGNDEYPVLKRLNESCHLSVLAKEA